MPKSKSFLSLVVGAIAGAAAVFFSDEDNRQKANRVARDVKKKVHTLASEYQSDPAGTKKKLVKAATKAVRKTVAKGKKVAKKVVTQSKKAVKKVRKNI